MDTVIDLVEATGATITDREAMEVVLKCEKDQLEATTLDSFLRWWRGRVSSSSGGGGEGKEVEGWRKRVAAFHDLCEKGWELIERTKQALRERVKIIREEKESREREEEEESGGNSGTIGNATAVAEGEEEGGVKKGGPKSPPPSSSSQQQPPIGRVAISINVGHFKEPSSSMTIEVLPTTTTTTSRKDSTTITAIELLKEEHQERLRKVSVMEASRVKRMGMVVWCDVVLKPHVSDIQADLLAQQVQGAFQHVPQVKEGGRKRVVGGGEGKDKPYGHILFIHLFLLPHFPPTFAPNSSTVIAPELGWEDPH